ncbi:MAG: right-handed parallel beta-helix repeat-containing protein [Deltaproteobacteria bacterium]|nr:right-handed parallel beta-helix repeat-containing protein [Deltaproteobacteria bacterium]
MRRFRTTTLSTLATLAAFAAVPTMGCAVDTPSSDDGSDPSLTSAEETGETASPLVKQGDGTTDPPVSRCVTDATGSITASATSIALGGTATVRWSVRVPTGCSSLRIYVSGQSVSASGSMVLQPQANTVRSLFVSYGSAQRSLGSVSINVQLPPRVDITSNDQAPLFVQAVQTPNTTVVVANHVQLDLSNRQGIGIASNVLVQGGRAGLQAGPRLFTTTRPPALFEIRQGISNVRITGVRIEGPDMGAVDRNGATAVEIDSATNVEIDHDEISGWAGSGVGVRDTLDVMASPSPTASVLPAHTVNVHDNFIHHNQAVGGDGYGVVVGHGAHVMIARNVFDWNRHAIAGDGRPGTGYTAYYNLVLENGGLHRWIPFPGFWTHTHQFDMHGRDHCGIGDLVSDSLYNCGPAGHTMLIRHNTFFYSEDDNIKLRGTPSVGMFVGENVFANDTSFSGATSQEESGLVEEPGNVYGYNGKNQLGTCDFDGDGINDSFMATGESWWYRSGTTGPWEFLNASKKKLSEVSIGFFDSDNRCDVRADGVVFPGGRPAPRWGAVLGNLGSLPLLGN